MSNSIRISDRTVTRELKNLSTDFYVRRTLNHDWAIHLGQLLEAGTELNPIYITKEDKVVDGRHRIEAAELANKTEIKCKIVEADSDVDLIIFAADQNIGGNLPQTQEDMEHTLSELLNRGVPKKELFGLFKSLPPKVVKKYLTSLESRLHRAKLAKAASAVVEGGLSTAQAAGQYEVPEKDLRTMLSGTTKRKNKRGIEEIKANFSKVFGATGNKNAAAIRNLLEMYENGDVSHKQVLDVFKHVVRLIKQSERNATNWRKRFDAMEAPRKIA